MAEGLDPTLGGTENTGDVPEGDITGTEGQQFEQGSNVEE